MSQEVLKIAARYDEQIKGMEDKAIARLNRALETAYGALEKDLVKSYSSISSNATLLQSQRRALIFRELGSLLQIVNPDKSANYEAIFGEVLRDTTNAGFEVAGLFAQALGNEKLKPLSDIAIEAVAASAKGTYQRLLRYGDSFADTATNIISQGIVQGWGVQRVLTPLQQQLGVTKQRAEMVARTETISAYNDAANERYAKANIENILFIAIGDRRTCPYCLNRHLQVYPRGSMRPPLHPYCVTGDSLVLSDRVLNVTRRYYSGDIFVIETTSGNKLTITPNHPALTTKGWVKPKLLMIGDDLISCTNAQRMSKAFGNPDDNQRPTTIEEVFTAFSKSGDVMTTEVPVTAEHFHGDFGSRESNVDIVNTNSLLCYGVVPGLIKPLFQEYFFANSCLFSGINLGTLNTSIPESGTEFFGADSDLPSSILQRFAGLVQSDRIVNITKTTHNGYVYNLETKTGYYACNNLIIHNCRCTLAPWQESWRQAGIIDVNLLAEQREKALAEAKVAPNSEPAPFEKLAGIKKIPAPIYTPVFTPRAVSTLTSGSGEYTPPEPKSKQKRTPAKPKEAPINYKVERSDAKALEKLGEVFTRRNLPAPKLGMDSVKPYQDALDAVKAKMDAQLKAGVAWDEKTLNEFRKAEDAYYKAVQKVEDSEERAYMKLRDNIKKKHGNVAVEAAVRSIYFDDSLSDKDIKYLTETFTDFYQLTGNKGSISINELRKDDPRAYATNGGAINIGGGEKRTIFHEAFHHVEFESKKLETAANQWRDEKATSKKPEKLSKLTGIAAYDDDEVALPDKYIDSYVGKVYRDRATEVLSMGGEHFHSARAMRELRQKDPNHFNLIMGVLVSE